MHSSAVAGIRVRGPALGFNYGAVTECEATVFKIPQNSVEDCLGGDVEPGHLVVGIESSAGFQPPNNDTTVHEEFAREVAQIHPGMRRLSTHGRGLETIVEPSLVGFTCP